MPASTHCPDLATALHDGTSHRGAGSELQSLLDLQFWLIGRDVEHPDGNLLIRMGFNREPAPQTLARFSRYRRATRHEHVVLWSWGVFLQRSTTKVMLTRGGPPSTVHTPGPPDIYQPPPAGAGEPCSPAMLTDACAWLASYEDHVTSTAGLAHRVPRPGPAPKLAPPEPWSLAAAWHELGTNIARSVTTPPAQR